MRRNQGFTLIELVAVIVILGILAAVAVPKFFNLSSEARSAALKGVIGSIESASTLNYAAWQASPTGGATSINGDGCHAAISAIMNAQTSIGANYTVGTGTISGSEGSIASCTLTDKKDSTVTGTASLIIAGKP